MMARKILYTLAFLCFFQLAFAAEKGLSPVGYWKTIDDVSGKPKAILQLYMSGQTLNGKIVKTFVDKSKPPVTTCTACKGSKHNQPLVGMVVLEGLTVDQNSPTDWKGGEILDPKTGKEYHCTLKVVEGGRKLMVRGYVGLPLLGRTQTWIRVGGAQ